MKNSNSVLKLQNKAQGAAVVQWNEMQSLFISQGIYKSGKECKNISYSRSKGQRWICTEVKLQIFEDVTGCTLVAKYYSSAIHIKVIRGESN